MNMAEQLFQQADLNHDQRLDKNEFQNFFIKNFGQQSENFSINNLTNQNQFALSGDAANSYLGGFTESQTSSNSFVQSSSSFGESGFSGIGTGGLAAGGYNVQTLSGGDFGTSSIDTIQTQQNLQFDANNTANIYRDPNPQIIRRPAPGGGVTYTQNIRVRFLQPPPVPPPGPLIIKEVRPPQPSPPPPLRIRQQAPPLPQPPPLVLRERPPVPPASSASQTVIRRLESLPIPPRSVIIERLPPLPPRPRDIIIERWIPYAAQAKRRTIVQRAGAAQQYPKPRNVIIQYEPIEVRIARQFQRLGVTQENPQLYLQRYGATLLDSQMLLQQARAAGVIEDTNPSFNVSAISSAGSSFTNDFSTGVNTFGGLESSNYNITQGTTMNFSGLQSAQNLGISSQQFDFTSSGGNLSGFQTYGNTTGVDEMDPAVIAFNAADKNKDGKLDAYEFRDFLNTQLYRLFGKVFHNI